MPHGPFSSDVRSHTLLIALAASLVLPGVARATTCDFSGIQRGDLCPSDCTYAHWGNLYAITRTDCHAACTMGVMGCDMPCWNCDEIVEVPPNDCTSSNANTDLLYWAYPVHAGRPPAQHDLNQQVSPYSHSPWEDHYTQSPFYTLTRATGGDGLFDLTGLNGTPYRSWDLTTPDVPYTRYHYFVGDFETGEPFLYQLSVHDRDTLPGGSASQIACAAIIQADYAYDPAAVELLAIESGTSHPAGCQILSPGQLRCFFDKAQGGLHLTTQENIFGRPIAPVSTSGNVFQGTLTLLAQEWSTSTVTASDGTPGFVGATGAPKQRSVAQLVTGEPDLFADIDAALARVIARRRAALGLGAVGGSTHALLTPARVRNDPHDFGAPASDGAVDIELDNVARVRFTPTGLRFWGLTNGPRPLSPNLTAPPAGTVIRTTQGLPNSDTGFGYGCQARPEPGYDRLGYLELLDTCSHHVALAYLEADADSVSGWAQLTVGNTVEAPWFFFNEALSQNHFDVPAPAPELTCAADGRTVELARGDLEPIPVGTCALACVPGGLCTLAGGGTYPIYTLDPPPAGGVDLIDACTPGQGAACPAAAFRNLCLDGSWGGCPSWPHADGETRSCDCGACCAGYGTQTYYQGEWGSCEGCVCLENTYGYCSEPEHTSGAEVCGPACGNPIENVYNVYHCAQIPGTSYYCWQQTGECLDAASCTDL